MNLKVDAEAVVVVVVQDAAAAAVVVVAVAVVVAAAAVNPILPENDYNAFSNHIRYLGYLVNVQ